MQAMVCLPRPSRGFGVLLALILAALAVAPTAGQERQLNQGHPVRLDDAFPLVEGGATVLAAGTFRLQGQGSNRGVFPLDAQYVILPDLQISIGTVLTTEPHDTSDPSSGDLNVAGRVALGRQTDLLPVMALQLGTTLPTGLNSRATDVELKGLATRSLTLGLLPVFLHLNTAAEFRTTNRRSDERLARYHLVTGLSFTIPQQATTTLVADIFADQAVQRGGRPTVGVEAGLRHRLAPRVAIGAALGSEFAGPGARAPLYATVGISVDFDVPVFRKAPSGGD
jgi:hypothetical protein